MGFWMSFGLFLMGFWACSSLNLVAAASPACNYSSQTCGGLSIPYPFGMSSECGLPDYRISCKHNSSYGAGLLPFLHLATASTAELQVLEFNSYSYSYSSYSYSYSSYPSIIVNSTHLKAMPTPDNCGKSDVYAEASLELPSSGPFVLSDGNMFAVIGCRSEGSCVASSSTNASSFTTTIQCSTGCYNRSDDHFKICNTHACCINAIQPGSRHLNFSGNGISYPDFPGVCGFSTVLNPNTYEVNSSQVGILGAGQYGLSIAWALILSASENCTTVKQRSDYACSEHASCTDVPEVPGYACYCGYWEGDGDGYKNGTGCRPGKHGYINSGLVLFTVLGVLAGAFVLTILIIIIRWLRRGYRRKQQREENFHRNGGEELRSMLFSEDELKRATNNFSHEHELGKGGYGTVYWGNLPNHGKVAIKKPKHMEDTDMEEDQMKSFVSEILLLGKTMHENVVRLLGCCVETRVPLLVYEFVENGTLWDHLHPGKDTQRSLLGSSWARRLHIAVDTAKALSYLHKMTPPILHRDIKSANILIDKSYNPKVADFGASRFLTSNATHLTFAIVVGTHGYLDPEYHLSSKFTNKSDVFSFGVILLELITAMPADLGTKLGILSYHFQTRFRTGNLTNLVDHRLSTNPIVLASIQEVAELAIHCLAMEGHQRPTMEEVLGKLKEIQSKWTLVEEVEGVPSASIENYMRPIVSQQIVGISEECESSSLLDYSWSRPSHQSATTTTTNSEIVLISLQSLQTVPTYHKAATL